MGPFCWPAGLDGQKSVAQRLQDILAPEVEALGYELWHLELQGSGNNRLLRLYIDAPDGIDLEDCEAVSRQVSAILDVQDPLPGRYRLEVSSPGLDRPLVTPAHFQRFVNQSVRVRLYAPQAGRRRLVGRNLGCVADALRLDCDGEVLLLPLAGIAAARLVSELDWQPTGL